MEKAIYSASTLGGGRMFLYSCPRA